MKKMVTKQEKRGIRKRIRRKMIVIGCEGNNITEKNYFQSLSMPNYRVIFAPGNDTDPVHIVNCVKKKIMQIDTMKGDMAFCVFDIDNLEKQEKQFLEAKKIADKKSIQMISSNPCFEVWFLEHFIYTTKPFSHSKDVIEELKKYIPDYDKTKNYSELLNDKLEIAMANCKKLELYHLECQHESILSKNPSSLVYEIFDKIESN